MFEAVCRNKKKGKKKIKIIAKSKLSSEIVCKDKVFNRDDLF